MSEKRFTIDKIFKEYPKLRDNETECFYHLVDNERNAEIFCERLNKLVEENRELNSIKKFAERNGINIFLIDEAFRKCWKDNKKLIEKNEQLKQELRGMDELLKSYRETIKHDAELLADATRNGYLPPLDDFVKR